MRIVMFYHSLASCWNHGNAHFLRGLARALQQQNHQVIVYEPENGWSRTNLVAQHGTAPLREFRKAFPELRGASYSIDRLDLDRMLDRADLVIVHEWNDRRLVARVGEYKKRSRSFKLLFHDTHHRMVSAAEEMADYDLRHYDGVLAFGEVLTQLYQQRCIAQRAWTFHEAADTSTFFPSRSTDQRKGDLVWIGNWGDGERSRELNEFLFEPIRQLGLNALIHGVRYPEHALEVLRAAGAHYGGWIANHQAARVFREYGVTVHVPRRLYRDVLPGIPTIRVFEALAAGIPLISSPWLDTERLFEPGRDFLVANDGREMQRQLRDVLNDPELARTLRERGRTTILERHTCVHRASQLMSIYKELNAPDAAQPQPAEPTVTL